MIDVFGRPGGHVFAMSFFPEPVVEDKVERKGDNGEVDNVEHYLQK